MSKIKTERLRLGLTQQQLADLLGIPFRTIQNWEGGINKCPDYVERLILDKLQDTTCICPKCGAEMKKMGID